MKPDPLESGLDQSIRLDEFARIFAIRGPRLMWLLGAGASVTAGVPTAGQMIDDFKAVLYATIHDVPLASINLGEPGIRMRVQLFFDTHPDFPSLGEADEYSRLFEATWPDAKDRRSYIETKISSGKPAYAHIGLAALIALTRIQLMWTTNFDRVIEDAVASVMPPPSHLTVSSLDTSQIAEQAIAQGRFPLLVKLHGDYQSEYLKNTRQELQTQEASCRAALIESCSSKGLIVCGYSGRDQSLMHAFDEALTARDPFPDGLYWARRHGDDLRAAAELLRRARDRGVDARWIDVQTFDELIARLLQTVAVPVSLQDRLKHLRETRHRQPFVLPDRRGDWPAIWLNALEITSYPTTCRQVTCSIGGTSEVRRALSSVRAIGARRRAGVICFGVDSEIRAALQQHTITAWAIGGLTEDSLAKDNSSELGLLYDALSNALAGVRPLLMVRSDHSHCLLIDPSRENDSRFEPLRSALEGLVKQRPNVPGGASLSGTIPGTDLAWREGVRLHLTLSLNSLWLVFEPFIWAEYDPSGPNDRRTDFIGRRGWHRYNRIAAELFNAWAHILVTGRSPSLFGISDEDGVDARFEFSDRIAHARAGLGSL